MKFGYLFLLLSGISFSQVSAQDCSLSLKGTIYKQNTEVPLAFASIYIRELDKGVIADSIGHFEIDDLCPGTYTVVCDHIQCNMLEVLREVNHEHQYQEFFLGQNILELDEVKIVGEKLKAPPTQSIARINGRQLESTRGLQLGEALASLPGISLLKTGATIVKPVIHGLHSNRILVLNNGIRQEAQQWGSEHAPEIDPFIATQLSLVKGANSVRYGAGAIGGVVLVEPAPLRDSAGIGGSINLVGFSNGRQGVVSGMLEGNSKKYTDLSWRLQGTMRKAGNLHTPEYFLDNTGIQEQNFSAALQYKNYPAGIEVFYSRFNSKLGILSPAHVGGLSDLELALSQEKPLGSDTIGFSYDINRPYQHIIHHLAKLTAYKRIKELGKLSTTYAFQFNHRREFDKHQARGSDPDGKDKAELDFKINTHTLETVWDHTLRHNISGTWGISGMYQNNRLDGRPFIPNFVVFSGEAFAIERWKYEKWEVEGGLRYDYRWIHSAREVQGIDIFTIQDFQNVTATLGAIYHHSPKLRFNTNIGTAWRPPNVNELFSDGLHHGAGAIEKGDSTLTPEQGIKWISTIAYRGNQGLHGEISIFYHHFNNFIYKRPGGIEKTIRGAFPVFQYAQTAARLQGVDLSIGYRFPFGLSWEGKAAYLDAWNIGESDPLIYMPANWFENTLEYTFQDGPKWSDTFIRTGFRQVLQQTRVPIRDNPAENDWLPPPEGYGLLNLEAGSTVSLGRASLSFSIRIDNLLNVAYRDYLNSFRYYADEVGRNISLRAKLTF